MPVIDMKNGTKVFSHKKAKIRLQKATHYQAEVSLALQSKTLTNLLVGCVESTPRLIVHNNNNTCLKVNSLPE